MSKIQKRRNKEQKRKDTKGKIIITPNSPIEIYDSNGVLRVKIGGW